MYTESNVKLSCNALWQKCVLATLYRAAATHPEIKLLQFKLIPGQGINKAIPSLMADFTGELHRLISEYLQCKTVRAETATGTVTTPAIVISLDIIKHRFPHYIPAAKAFPVDTFHLQRMKEGKRQRSTVLTLIYW